MSLRFYHQHRFALEAEEREPDLKVRAVPGEPLNVSWAVGVSQTRDLEVTSERGEVYLVEDRPKPGFGFFREQLRPVPEKLLKTDLEQFDDGYEWRRPRWFRRSQPYYLPPRVPLGGPVRIRLTPEIRRQFWWQLNEQLEPGRHFFEVMVEKTSLTIEAEILPLRLLEPPQTRMIWTRARLSPSPSRHHVDPERMRLQFQDISRAGFDSFSLNERSQGLAQQVLDLAAEAGLAGRVVFTYPFADWLPRLNCHQLTPTLYLSDEVDRPGGTPMSTHRAAYRRARQLCPQWPTMVSVLNHATPGRLLQEATPDIVSLCLDGREASMAFTLPQPTFYYWQTLVEKPNLHRWLGGFGLYASKAQGISPYCYQHLPPYPSSPFRDQDPWDQPDFKQHMATYPCQGGRISTVQWEGLSAGLWDLKYLTTWKGELGDEALPTHLHVGSPERPRVPDLDRWRDGVIEELLQR